METEDQALEFETRRSVATLNVTIKSSPDTWNMKYCPFIKCHTNKLLVPCGRVNLELCAASRP